MPRPAPSVDAYKDVVPFLTTAVEHGYLQLEFETDNQAIHITHRLNRWRLIQRSIGIYDYDAFVFSRTGRVVVIKQREVAKTVSIKDENGNEVALDMSIPKRILTLC